MWKIMQPIVHNREIFLYFLVLREKVWQARKPGSTFPRHKPPNGKPQILIKLKNDKLFLALQIFLLKKNCWNRLNSTLIFIFYS